MKELERPPKNRPALAVMEPEASTWGPGAAPASSCCQSISDKPPVFSGSHHPLDQVLVPHLVYLAFHDPALSTFLASFLEVLQ